ncbi:hypothetical protein SNOG_00109 [Parastagonospora nodorum SN15]|uniref:Uncharacterized protein n=1 Tax=Phaeosphaeria nodorum (strain SN15 / ATCC MYA-4574 / FGSC 10173) TaxID=321614 RepID=Q0V7A5_PHANO|nr:hypothetical protein SNOG_00109 [Parastagonospora nodorum SN15]EAT91604.1 hypothetical protein SNOG_00109 [Parastagonospora nodorum SN15]
MPSSERTDSMLSEISKDDWFGCNLITEHLTRTVLPVQRTSSK